MNDKRDPTGTSKVSARRRPEERLKVVLQIEDDFDGLLELTEPEIYVIANRAACARLSALFARAATSESGAFGHGSSESRELLSALNDHLVSGSNVWFYGFALDEAL